MSGVINDILKSLYKVVQQTRPNDNGEKKSSVSSPPSTSRPIDRENREVRFLSYVDNLMEGCISDPFVALTMRSIRIGSYKIVAREKVVLCSKGLRLILPSAKNEAKKKVILFKSDIMEMHARFDKQLSIIVIIPSTESAARMRETLDLTPDSGYKLDPTSADLSVRRIILVPDRVDENSATIMNNLYSEVIKLMDGKAAMDVVIRLADTDSRLMRRDGSDLKRQPLFRYPPNGAKPIEVTNIDYLCLENDSFFNDVIIDFYVNWIESEVVPEHMRNKVHFFSTYFYNRLTSLSENLKRASTEEERLRFANNRYNCVKRWTRKVNLFEKDFIVVPINYGESHWIVAIICYPGLTGPVDAATGRPCPIPQRQIRARRRAEERTIQSKKKLAEATQNQLHALNGLVSDLTAMIANEIDEYASDDNLINEDTTPNDEDSDSDSGEKRTKNIKQPCILIFDSLQNDSRAKIVSLLREYLECEFRERIGVPRIFDKANFPGCSPKVMQQSNFSDCGVFLLHFIETFFKTQLDDFTLPPKGLNKSMFSRSEIHRKRAEMAGLIRRLTAEMNPKANIFFPDIQFLPPDHLLFDSDEDDNSIGSDQNKADEPVSAEFKSALEKLRKTSEKRKSGSSSDVAQTSYSDSDRVKNNLRNALTKIHSSEPSRVSSSTSRHDHSQTLSNLAASENSFRYMSPGPSSMAAHPSYQSDPYFRGGPQDDDYSEHSRGYHPQQHQQHHAPGYQTYNDDNYTYSKRPKY